MRRKLLVGLGGIVVFLACLFLFQLPKRPSVSERQGVPEETSRSQQADSHQSPPEATSRGQGVRNLVPPLKRESQKRIPRGDSNQLVWLADGWRLVDEGKFAAARVRFQTLINEHKPGEPGMPYALLAISETYVLEGGEENLRAGYDSFRDFLVFYPDHELAAHARTRIAELKRLLPPKQVEGAAR